MVNEQELKQMHDKIAELEERVVQQRARADRAETFICTMCAECKWEENNGMLFMQKSCGHLFPLDCNKFKLRSLWIPVTERLPEKFGRYLAACENIPIPQIRLFEGEWESIAKVTHWMPLPEQPKEVE
jgi:hypothetical protein